jgi:hypothetical protein
MYAGGLVNPGTNCVLGFLFAGKPRQGIGADFGPLSYFASLISSAACAVEYVNGAAK